MQFPVGPYDVVLADPPWAYTGSPTKWAAAGKHYSLMGVDAIGALPVREVLAPKAVLFCWATGPKLHHAIGALDAWGLHYRGVAFVWVKTARNGVPLKAQGVRPSIVKPLTEFVLAASTVPTGRPLPIADEAVVQTVFAPKRRHSEKPETVQDRIDLLYPDARKLELFARRPRAGWDCWGDELPDNTADDPPMRPRNGVR